MVQAAALAKTARPTLSPKYRLALAEISALFSWKA